MLVIEFPYFPASCFVSAYSDVRVVVKVKEIKDDGSNKKSVKQEL